MVRMIAWYGKKDDVKASLPEKPIQSGDVAAVQ